MKYVGYLALLATGETVLQGVIANLIEVGKCCGMEMNVEEIIVMRTVRQPLPGVL